MTHACRHKRKFCTDTFRLTIRESRVRDVYPTIDDVTAPCEPLYVIVSVIVVFRNLSDVVTQKDEENRDIRNYTLSQGPFYQRMLTLDK